MSLERKEDEKVHAGGDADGGGDCGVYAGEEDNEFNFSDELYNILVPSSELASGDDRTGSTSIIVKTGKGWKFSGKSDEISGNSTIDGIEVTLKLSNKLLDTQVKGWFVPVKDNPSEDEYWVPSNSITVINHYIMDAYTRQSSVKTKVYAVIMAEKKTLGEPLVVIEYSPLLVKPAKEKLNYKGSGEWRYKSICRGHRSAKVKSTFVGDVQEAVAVLIKKKK